jgi:LysM repeat protein
MMMFKKSLILLFLLVEVSIAEVIVDCRVITGSISKCNPYSLKFVKAKEIEYEKDRHKLIVEKTLPVPPKKSLKVISTEEMIEKYVKIEEPVRYKGTETVPLIREEKTQEIKEQKIYSRIEKLKIQREALLKKMQKIKEEKEKKYREILKATKEKEKVEKLKIVKHEKKKDELKGFYTIEKGDSLSTIATKFSMKKDALRALNHLKKDAAIRIGKKLVLPFNQRWIDTIAKAEYIVRTGDSLGSIAQEFNLSSSEIVKFNKIKKSDPIRIGQKLRLPLSHVAIQEKQKAKKVSTKKVLTKKQLAKKPLVKKANTKKAAAKKKKKLRTVKLLRGFGKRKLRVTATAYSSHRAQTDKTPFLAAWNNRIRPGMKIIAVSRDMLKRYGLRNGSKVKIGGLSGYYTVRDKMNKRFRKRIDIYMGTNRRRALRWGRRSVMLYW